MPIHIDESWEYYTPDPELLELSEWKVRIVDQIRDYRAEDRGWNLGFSFGKGNPNYSKTYLGKPKKKATYKEEKKAITCPVCKKSFTPRDSFRKVCSIACRTKGNTLVTEVYCKGCNKNFLQKETKQVYCSPACGGKHSRMNLQRDKEFIECYLRGDSIKEMKERFQTAKSTLFAWKNRLNLPSRKAS